VRTWRVAWRSFDDVAFELAVLDYLEGRGIPVAPGIRARDGSAYFTAELPEGPRPIAVFRWAPGHKLGAAPNRRDAERVGEAFADLHLAATGFVPSKPRRTNAPAALRANLPTFLRMVEERPEDAGFYIAATERIAAALEALDPSRVPFGTNHGDFHCNNVHIDGVRMTLLDFDNSGGDFFAQDVACYLWANTYIGIDGGLSDGFLEGYERRRPLSSEERRLMPLFILAKEFRLISTFSRHVDAIGRGFMRRDFAWFRASIERRMAEAGLS
jgi:Ser/Thr protein kinase RdoA (MazF antagonist)